MAVGCAHFEERLVDSDVASNWGNWANQVEVGNDSMEGQFTDIFQAQRYDGDAEYVTAWLPELDGVPPASTHSPWRLDGLDRAEYGVRLGIDHANPTIDVEARYRELRGR